MSINKVCLSGHLTRDPELRQTANGFPVLGFGIGVNERRKNPQTGEWYDQGNFFDCVMYGGRTESVAQYLAKGSKVAIEGKLRWSQWERDGQKRSKVDVVVDNIEFMSQAKERKVTYTNDEVVTRPDYLTEDALPWGECGYAGPTGIATEYDEEIPF